MMNIYFSFEKFKYLIIRFLIVHLLYFLIRKITHDITMNEKYYKLIIRNDNVNTQEMNRWNRYFKII